MEEPIERYLDRVEGGLRRLGTLERQEWREEARQHLLALVDAHEELGLERSRAVEAALEQFGDARRLAGSLRAAARRGARPIFAPGSGWLLGALFWNTFLWRLFLIPNLEERVLLIAALFGAGHACSAAFLAWGPKNRLSTRDRWTSLIPYFFYQVCFGLAAVPEILRGHRGSGLFLAVLLVNLAFLGLTAWLTGQDGKRAEEQRPVQPA